MEKTIIDESCLHDDLIKFINERNGILQNVEVRRILSLDGEEITFNSLHIQDCVFTEKVVIKNINKFDFIIDINSSTFKHLYFVDCNLFTINYDRCSSSLVHLSSIAVLNFCEILLNEKNRLFCYNFKGHLNLNSEEKFSGKVIVNGSETDCDITSMSDNTILEIIEARNVDIYGNYNKVQIGKVAELELGAYTLNQGEKIIYNHIKGLSFQSKSNKGAIIIEEMEIENLEFFYFLNTDGIASLQNLKIKNTSIQNSILGPINFNNVIFTDKLEIEQSDISKITYSNVSWVKRTFITLFDDEIFLKSWLSKDDKEELREDLIELRDNRETYRQLKLVAQNMKNKHDELEFARLENRLLWKEARVSKSMNWQDRFIIFTNRWSADFGQSWAMPLGWLMVIHLILFMCLFNWQFSCNLEHFENGIGVYLKLLNPVHQSPEFISTGMGHITEFCMRISSGFFIYHFLRATRKYVQS